MPKRRMIGDTGVEVHQTAPCPRCGSSRTQVILLVTPDKQRDVLLRHCRSCRWRWDYIQELAPRSRRVKGR